MFDTFGPQNGTRTHKQFDSWQLPSPKIPDKNFPPTHQRKSIKLVETQTKKMWAGFEISSQWELLHFRLDLTLGGFGFLVQEIKTESRTTPRRFIKFSYKHSHLEKASERDTQKKINFNAKLVAVLIHFEVRKVFLIPSTTVSSNQKTKSKYSPHQIANPSPRQAFNVYLHSRHTLAGFIIILDRT